MTKDESRSQLRAELLHFASRFDARRGPAAVAAVLARQPNIALHDAYEAVADELAARRRRAVRAARRPAIVVEEGYFADGERAGERALVVLDPANAN